MPYVGAEFPDTPSLTSYEACSASLQYVIDTHPHLSLSLLPVHLEYPVSHAQVIKATKVAIEGEEARGGRVRLALLDAISSNPGVIVPWEELTKLCKEHKIIRCVFTCPMGATGAEVPASSLIDAAHQIGQLPVNLRESQPGEYQHSFSQKINGSPSFSKDYWVSNCHKWLLGHRGCAVLYVAKPCVSSLLLSLFLTKR